MYDDEGNELKIVLPEGTVKDVAKNVKIKDTNGDSYTMTLFFINGDNNAKALFEFMAQPGTTTDVEWSRTKIGTESSEKNVVGNGHRKNKTYQMDYLLTYGYTITYDAHNHPKNFGSSKNDRKGVAKLLNKFPNAKRELYRNNEYEPIPLPYDTD